MSSTALLIALKLGFWRKNVIHGTFSSANTLLSNEKMSSTALLTALKARYLDEKYRQLCFKGNTSLTNDKMSSTALLIALKLGFLMKKIIHGTFF